MGNRGGLMGAGVVMASILLGLSGCASEAPKSTSTMTPEQVRGHADKAFEKLKLEEQDRSADPAMPR
jgi:type IV pilus biogenesis protein CpaD/CtpE